MTRLSYNNIFDAITDDTAEAADLQFRAELMLALRDYCDGKGWSRAQISENLGVAQSRVSELMTGKIHLASADKLILYCAKLGMKFHASYQKPSENSSAKIALNTETEELDFA